MPSSNTGKDDIYTAVSLAPTKTTEKPLEEPLLQRRPVDDDECSVVDTSDLNSCFRWHGLVIGFLAQLINVSGTTYMYYRWDHHHDKNAITHNYSNNSDDELSDTILHGFIWLITQVDLYLYIFMWLSLTAVLTKSGMNYVRTNFFHPQSKPTKRSIFVLGVQFYVGVVLGVFFAWTGIDFLLGLPVPVMPMVGVLLFGLFISYTMVWCYDLEDVEDDEDEGQDEVEEV